MRYRVNLQTKTCQKRTLNDTFRPFGVPDYAKYLDTVEIGSNAVPNAGIQVTLWAGDNPGSLLITTATIIIRSSVTIFFYIFTY